jgi:diaminopimelate decarboxylase
LVERYGTPLYVFDQDDLIARATHCPGRCECCLCAGTAMTGSVYYASKSFISGHVVSWIEELDWV